MAGWLSKDWTSKLDTIKSQVSNMAKEVFVEDEDDTEGGTMGGSSTASAHQSLDGLAEADLLKELHRRCAFLEQQNKEAVKDKEEQCENFRQLLLEKEEEISILQQMLDTGQHLDDTGGQDSYQGEKGESNLEIDKLTAKNTKLQEQMKEVRAKLKDSDSQLKTARLEMIEKEKYRCESEEKCTFFQKQMDELQERLSSKVTEADNFRKSLEDKDVEVNELLQKLVAKDGEIEEMQSMQESEFKGLKNLLKEKDIKLKETTANFEHQLRSKESEWNEKMTSLMQELEQSNQTCMDLEQRLTLQENEFKSELLSMTSKLDEVNSQHMREVDLLQQDIERIKCRDEVDSLDDSPTDTIAEENETMVENENIKQENEELNEKINSLTNELNDVNDKIVHFEKENKHLKEELEIEKNNNEKSSKIIEDFHKEASNKVDKSMYEDIEKQVHEQQEELTSLQQQLTSLQENNTLINNQLKDKEIDLNNIQEKLVEKDEIIAKHKEENNQKKNEIISLINENKKLNDSKVKNETNGRKSSKESPGKKKDSANDYYSDTLDITKIVTENRELKDKLNSVLCDKERTRIGERKLEAGELTILLKMKNLDLEQRCHKIQEENTILSVENMSLRSKSAASSVLSFPSSCNDLSSPGYFPPSPGLPESEGGKADLSQLLSEKDSLREKNQELAMKISEMENENQSLRKVLLENNKLDTKLKVDLNNISVECEKLKYEIENVDYDSLESRLSPVEDDISEDTIASDDMKDTKAGFQQEIEKLNQIISQMKERLRIVNKNLFDSADKDVTIEQLREEVAVKENEIQALNEKENLLNDQLNALTQQVKDKEEKLKDTSNDITALKTENNDLQSNIQSIKEELNQFREANVNKDHEIQSIKLELLESEKHVNRVEHLEHTLKETLERYEKLKEDFEIQNDNLSSEKVNLSKQIGENEFLLKEKDDQINQLKEALVQKEDNSSVLTNKVAELNQALTDIKGMNEMFLNTAREKEKELNISKKISSQLEKEKEEMIKSVEKLSSECNNLKEKLTETEAKCSSLMGEISRLEAELSQRLEATEELTRELQMAQMDNNKDDDSPLVQVLNEKSKELSDARIQIQHFTQSLQQERERVAQLEASQIEMRSSYNEMQEEGMKRLTCLVRDKELEMTSIQEKYKTILKVLDQEKAAQQKLVMEKQELVLLTEQLRKDIIEKEAIQATSNHVNDTATSDLMSSNPNCDNTNNEQLKLKITELETKLAEYSSKMVEITEASGGGQDQSSLACQLQLKVDDYTKKLATAQQEIAKLRSASESQLAEKSSEYTTEVDRLRNDMKTLAIDRNAIESRLKGREKEVSDLHKEVKSVIEKKKWVEGELERLRSHLVTVEETYTQELVLGEERESELRARVGKLEDQVKRASLSHSEASQEATEAATHLTEALTAAAATRDSLSEQLRVSQTKLREKTSSLRNLQLALEGFQRQKENEIRLAERKCHNLIEVEQTKCKEMENQLAAAKKQLAAANEGLTAATRLSQELELKQHHIAALKHEIATMEELLKEANNKVKTAATAQVGKVDRELVKNLILGYVTADNNKRSEILRIIATVLDFNQEDRGRTGLDGSGQGWLGGFLSRNPSAGGGSNRQLNESIAQAFVKFLEEESVPQQAVQLPVLEMARRQQEQLMSGATPRSTPSPLLLNSLPTFSPTSTILKSVLDEKDEEK